MSTLPDLTARATQAGLLAWLIPGGGHFYLGHRVLGVVYFVAISVPYVLGLAFGGIKSSIDPIQNYWLFLAEMGVGAYTIVGYLISRAIPAKPEYVSYFPASELAQIYLATAGLLNVLAVLDALARAQTGGRPVFYHEIAARTPPDGVEGRP